MTSTDPHLIDRAVRLFTYLSRVTALQSKPVRDVDAYKRDGAVYWLADFPDHGAVQLGQAELGAPEELLVTLDRVTALPAPELPELLRGWVKAPLDDPRSMPELSTPPEFAGPAEAADELELRREPFAQWLAAWQAWSSKDEHDRPVRELYHSLFTSHVQAEGNTEELELVLALGCLVWEPASGHAVRRHVFTTPVESTVDPATGQIRIQRATGSTGLRAELEVLDPAALQLAGTVEDTARDAQDFEGALLSEQDFAPLGRAFVNRVDPDGRYDASAVLPRPSEQAALAWAPAVILRKRSRANLAIAFQRIAKNIEQARVVPAGLLPLLDPSAVSTVEPLTTPGALLPTSHGPMAPLPLNERQFEILRHTNAHAQTLVQGPPGTGKTHTAAALLAHLLAQGQRVLVTAHTDRALQEVRGKLPGAVKPLAVSVLGGSRTETQELKLSIETISRRSAEHVDDEAERKINRALESFASLEEQRQRLEGQLRESREDEVRRWDRGPYSGTLADIARALRDDESTYGWIWPLVDFRDAGDLGLSAEQCRRWYELQRTLGREAPRARLLPLDQTPTADDLSALAEADSALDEAQRLLDDLKDVPGYATVAQLETSDRALLVEPVSTAGKAVRGVLDQPGEWRSWCFKDVAANNTATWEALHQELAVLLDGAAEALSKVPLGTTVELTLPPHEAAAIAQRLLQRDPNLTIKTDVHGMPKMGLFTPREIRDAAPLFQGARVNALPPTTAQSLQVLSAELEANRLLDEVDRRWVTEPATTGQASPQRLAQLRQRLVALEQMLQLRTVLEAARQALAPHEVPLPDWSSPHAAADLLALLQAADRADRARQAVVARSDAARELNTAAMRFNTPELSALASAFQRRDVAAYQRALDDLGAAHALADRHETRSRLTQHLQTRASRLLEAVLASGPSPEWERRFGQLADAWQWGLARSWIMEQLDRSDGAVQQQITEIDERMRGLVAEIAADRAWMQAVAPERLNPQARADLTQYAQLVRKLGKGTGKYAARRQAEIRQAMDHCRGSVPVWIMPIYRVVEQFDLRENMFDVVLVDEASQAGVSAVFLQYLAPRVVVIGDDKQVSPLAVGVDQEQLRRLARDYLHDDRYAHSWQDPTRSFFDEAKMRYGSPITLVEHRRCMPEIIGFSNEIAYAPDGNSLVPVRQYGIDRLDPIRIIHTPDAVPGSGYKKTNLLEAQTIVSQIEQCLADPRYDGKTLGVISLVGSDQAKLIETMLLQRVGPEVWEERDLRCGDATAFQGSERDVIFLSMVTAAQPGERVVALTRDDALQRFNVAVSRAKDQVWLVHSVALDRLGNPEDIRRRLLEYCYSTIEESSDQETEVPAAVPTDRVVAPFDSLFEQEVFNQIRDRGFLVEPKVDASGYVLDLVVSGQQSRLAVECLGDRWQGAEAYDRDMARQRELQRCGWTFFTVRESKFRLDPRHALDELWPLLEELGVEPLSDLGDVPGQGTPAVTVLRARTGAAPSLDVSAEDAASPGMWSAPEGEKTSIDDWPAEPAPSRDDHEPHRLTIPHQDPVPPVLPHPVEDNEESGDDAPWEPEPYQSYKGSLGPLEDLDDYEVAEGLSRIVRVEGPILGTRLYYRYMLLSGGGPLNRQSKKLLNQAVATAVRQGLMICDNPTAEPEMIRRAYRLASQPAGRVRRLGPRDISEVPPLELEALMQAVAEPGMDEDAVLRAALEALGVQGMTPRIKEHFLQARILGR